MRARELGDVWGESFSGANVSHGARVSRVGEVWSKGLQLLELVGALVAVRPRLKLEEGCCGIGPVIRGKRHFWYPPVFPELPTMESDNSVDSSFVKKLLNKTANSLTANSLSRGVLQCWSNWSNQFFWLGLPEGLPD